MTSKSFREIKKAFTFLNFPTFFFTYTREKGIFPYSLNISRLDPIEYNLFA